MQFASRCPRYLVAGNLLWIAASGLYAKDIIVTSSAEREEYIRNARVWNEVDVGGLDLYSGPPSDYFREPGGTMSCRFMEPEEDPKPIHGFTPKFSCKTTDGKRLKVKYGNRNPEVFGEVAGSRLLWALGFAADRNYSVNLECENCPAEPWAYLKNLSSYERRRIETDIDVQSRFPWPEQYFKADRVFNPAVIEDKHKGDDISWNKKDGWSWDELHSLFSSDPVIASEQKIHRDALTLLMSILQHTDSKPDNQRLMCAKGQSYEDAQGHQKCRQTFLVVHDLGWLFGSGFAADPTRILSRMNYDDWRRNPVWHDQENCVPDVKPVAFSSGLRPREISERGRQFLVERFQKLNRKHLEDIFRAARVELMDWGHPAGPTPADHARQWADVLVAKMAEVSETRCPK